MKQGKPTRVRRKILTLLIIPLMIANLGGCPADWCETFYLTASDSLQTGLTQILAGIVAGAFAVAIPHGGAAVQQTQTYSMGGNSSGK